ncbi:hypothetical protein DUZ99_07625 [Xylanibacillus composti]|uniref:MmcQ/YjbR family DNA-binding protein n=1 Tax=Xylanibacillus composti TaxID=1572762 RepID=A0A8J4H177_9BACL|nr:MmcQ/YjbR family DNA-binding protein [Xylanibacillus composti]MDT9724862.1 hypothetical protein [Xylanibacillus composti]GIQ69043.1 hypothetical protein XYCOK13_18670 [Xylanibacillus composti]
MSVFSKKMEAEHLRQQYASIRPGYYLNKRHWISIYYYQTGEVPSDLVEQLITSAYLLVYQSLTKKSKRH